MTNHAAKDREPLKQSRPSSSDRLTDRKEKFAALLAFVGKRNGWIVSVAGAPEVEMQCLLGSDLPEQLAQLGYELTPAGETERILPVAIVEHIQITEGSTATRAVQHAGIVKVQRYTFSTQ